MAEPTIGRELLPPDEVVRLLDADGVLTPSDVHPLELDDAHLVDLFRQMVITRRVDREAINLQRQGQLGVYASCMGQEAAQVGAAKALRTGDWVFPTYRELGMAIVRGVDPRELLHMFRGTWHGAHDPYAHGFAMSTIPIATQALHATGFAMGAKLDENPIVTVACFGDGAMSEGDLHEAMNFASVFAAPVVFFLQNNQWAISVPASAQSNAPTLAHRAVGYGMPGLRVDGNDVLATLAVMRTAVEHARSGAGPILVEAITYRRESHTTSDDHSRYRSADEVAAAAADDPIDRMERHLDQRGLLDDATWTAIEDAATAMAAAVREGLYDAPHGDPQELFSHVQIVQPPIFAAQSAQLARELAAREQAGDA